MFNKIKKFIVDRAIFKSFRDKEMYGNAFFQITWYGAKHIPVDKLYKFGSGPVVKKESNVIRLSKIRMLSKNFKEVEDMIYED